MEYTSFYETPFGGRILQEEANYVRSWLLHCNKILDIGCGPGVFEEKLDLNIVGVDTSKDMIRAAKKRTKNVLVAHAEFLPFKDSSFNGAFFVTSLEFMRDYKLVIDETTRILSKDGRMLALMLNPESEYFKDRLSRGGYTAENIKHTDLRGIKSYLSTKFDTRGEYFLGVRGNKVFDSNGPEYASLYAIRGRLK